MYLCDYPLIIKGYLANSGDMPPVLDLFTGCSFIIISSFICPITGVYLKANDFIFWDESYTGGVWRIMRADIPE